MNELSVIVKAADFAAFKHRNQRRKDADASPYINHPIALANLLCNEAVFDLRQLHRPHAGLSRNQDLIGSRPLGFGPGAAICDNGQLLRRESA